jgi:hypothetical protein
MAVAKRELKTDRVAGHHLGVMARWNCAGLRAPTTSRRSKRRPFSTPSTSRAHYEAEAIRMVDDGRYGLVAYWTYDIGSRLRAALAIESGWVQVKQGLGQASGTPTAAKSRAASAASSRSRERSRALRSAKT